MKTSLLLLIVVVFGFFRLQAQDSHTDIIPIGSSIKKLSSNQFSFTEGPVWYKDSVLLFTDDIPKIYSYDPVGKQFIEFHNNSAGCNGLSCDRDGNLIACSTQVVMMNRAGIVIKSLAAGYNGKPLNGPNDLIADTKGGVYFSDPVYFTTPSQDKEAVYYVDSIGNVKRIIDDLAKPNGLILSPDGARLYVVDSNNKYLYAWDVAADGNVSGKSSLAELQTTGGIASGADGMAIDFYGNIFVASEKGIQVFSPQGAAITTIVMPEIPSNCDFGGKDFKTLYITARKNIYSIDLNYPGYAVSRKALINGINLIPNKPKVEIYPNPAGDFLQVQLEPGLVNSIEVLNMDGQMESVSVKMDVESVVEVNTQTLKSGMYLLRMVYDGGILTRKFIKK